MSQFRIYILQLVVLTNAQVVSSPNIKDSRIRDKGIPTPLPQKSQRINGSKVYGLQPGKKIIYRIPCQGERPIQFKIDKLPEALLLAFKDGIISGVASTERGSYHFLIEAKIIKARFPWNLKISKFNIQ